MDNKTTAKIVGIATIVGQVVTYLVELIKGIFA